MQRESNKQSQMTRLTSMTKADNQPKSKTNKIIFRRGIPEKVSPFFSSMGMDASPMVGSPNVGASPYARLCTPFRGDGGCIPNVSNSRGKPLPYVIYPPRGLFDPVGAGCPERAIYPSTGACPCVNGSIPFTTP